MVDFEYTKSPQRAHEIAQLLRNEKSYCYDTETTGLDPHSDRVILASFSTRAGKTYLIDTRDPKCLEPFGDGFEDESVAKIGFNLEFDYSMTKGTIGRDLEGCRDLMLAEIALTCGSLPKLRSNLKEVTLKYLGKERDKTLQKSFIGHKGEFTQGQLEYAAEDTADLYPIADRMFAEIKKNGLERVWAVENNAIPAFADIGFYGQKIDVGAWKQIMVDNKILLINSMDELDEFFSVAYDRVSQSEFSFATSERPNRVDVNYASVPQVLYGLQTMGIQIDGKLIQETGKDVLKKVPHLPVIVAMNKFRKSKRALDAYGNNWLLRIHPNTGKIHPGIHQWNTETGRPAGRDKLNLLSLPREKRYRHAFIPEADDRMISTMDYSGAELRIMAELSGDPLMVKGFLLGVDFHCYVAAMLFNREKVEKTDPLRTPVKSLNFGLAYGMGPAKLCAQLNGEGYKITIEESFDLFKRYKETFKGAISWLNQQKQIAHRELVMTNINGRKRHWTAPNARALRAKFEEEIGKGSPLTMDQLRDAAEKTEQKVQESYAAIEREGANFQVQSVNVEWTKTAMYEMRKEFKRLKYDVKMHNAPYDETVLDAHKNCAEDVHALQAKIMISSAMRFMKTVPVEVEGHLKPYWTK